MSSTTGPCEWCGGPQLWTMVRGDMYVTCQADCRADQLELLDLPPVYAKGEEFAREHWEQPEIGRVGPPEGREAETSLTDVEYAGGPPQHFLDTMWEGYDG